MTTATNGRLGELDQAIAAIRRQGAEIVTKINTLNEKLNADTRAQRARGEYKPPARLLDERQKLHAQGTRLQNQEMELTLQRTQAANDARRVIARIQELEGSLATLLPVWETFQAAKGNLSTLLDVFRATPALHIPAHRIQEAWAVLTDIERMQEELLALRARLETLGVPSDAA